MSESLYPHMQSAEAAKQFVASQLPINDINAFISLAHLYVNSCHQQKANQEKTH